MAVDMAIELKPLGITVISVWPGFVQTEYGEIMVKKGAVTKATGLSQVYQTVPENIHSQRGFSPPLTNQNFSHV